MKALSAEGNLPSADSAANLNEIISMGIMYALLQSAHSTLATMVVIWPFVLLCMGLYFLVEPSGRFKKNAPISFVAAATLGLMAILLPAASYFFSTAAMPYQQVGLGLYYLLLIVWAIRTIRDIKAARA